MRRSLLCFCLLTLGTLGHAQAGSVITTGLPSAVEIVNIDAQQDGAAGYNGGNTGQAFWYQPFGIGPNGLLSVPVSPGTYTFDLIDPADAAKEFPSLTAAQLSTIFTAWTYNSPWITQYLVFDGSATTNTSESQLFDGATDPNSYSDAQDAYNATVADGGADLIQVDPVHGREGTNYTTTYTVTTATNLIFVIPDYDVDDNNGGVSVVVTEVPEPRSCILLLAAGGLLAAGWWRRRMNRQAIGA